ncbi:MAG TPA: polysaccharide biosynthesis/export family protein [Acidocella sp.]|nr:polysaccharide biosynthesis/export family protein [Acidocella sp.]
MIIRRRSVVFGGLVLLSGCATLAAPGAGLPPLPPPLNSDYRLGAGDQLTIRIYNQPQLSGSYSVDDSGMIDLPLLGLVRAAGQTADRLAASIASGLQAQKLILNPSVAVEVSTYRPFYILGEVNKPGQYPFRPDMTVLTAISIAGGFTYRAEQAYVGVTRDTGSNPAQYRAPLFALAQPGDVITVYERRF